MGRFSWDAEEVLNITEILASLAAAKKRIACRTGVSFRLGKVEGKGAIDGKGPFPVASSAETTPPSWA